MFRKSADGSTARLLELCVGYFIFYVITGITVKYFLGSAQAGLPGMDGIEFLVYSTVGGTGICLFWVLARRWYRFPSDRMVQVAGIRFPAEFLYIIPSGICTAVVIPTTTLMYTLPISVMVAMVIMRGSVIVISRVVDFLMIRQGILKKKVYAEENWGVVFAVAAVAVHGVVAREGGFDFIQSPAAMAILGSYILAYAIRIYIMNFYKNTRPANSRTDNRSFFAVEQIAASVTLLGAGIYFFFFQDIMGWTLPQIEIFHGAVADPRPLWAWAILAGMAFGIVAFFSVFIFMFKGRTATFAGLVNRLTSLIAGTASTLIFFWAFGGKFPKMQDWISLGFIFVAVLFLTKAEKRRAAELARSKSSPEGVKTHGSTPRQTLVGEGAEGLTVEPTVATRVGLQEKNL